MISSRLIICFVPGKRKRADVQEFQLRLTNNILSLHRDLKNNTYRHGGYEHFVVTDPKRRDINKASVRDRLVHHAIYRILYPCYDRKFINDSYSCRNNKGTHRAITKFKKFAGKISQNNTKTCWVLKCDIRKFFASIDQAILLKILEKNITDPATLELLIKVISSFNSGVIGVGLPLGNLTSQLLVNIYMNEFDQFVKHKLNMKYYIRYADDFVILNQNRNQLLKTFQLTERFLEARLKLKFHPKKVSITTFVSGVDFLGWVHFPHRSVLRAVTRKRVMRRLDNPDISESSRQSYLGLLSKGDTFDLQNKLQES